FLKTQAVGTQNYICLPSSSGFAWTFFSPQATVSVSLSSDVRQQVITHFLSPNPVENGTPRTTWQSSFDTSVVWGRAIQNTSAPNYVAQGAIPWLLLQPTGTQQGPTGGNLMAQTTYIHRLNTAGGVAPATGCSQASNVGAMALVPYTADYLFYRATAQQ